MDPNRDMLNDMYRMVKENNQMLHGIRRSAFISKLVKFIIAVLFLLAATWTYFNFVAPVLTSVINTMSAIQGEGAQAQQQLSAFQQTMKDLQAKVPSFLRGTTGTTSTTTQQ